VQTHCTTTVSATPTRATKTTKINSGGFFGLFFAPFYL
jgi:hypothetical protein